MVKEKSFLFSIKFNKEKIPFSTLILPTYNNFMFSICLSLVSLNQSESSCDGATIFPFFLLE